MLDMHLEGIAVQSGAHIQQLIYECKKSYYEMDKKLTEAFKDEKDPEILRTVALARTNIEISCMYAVKSICLQYREKKKEYYS